MKSILLLGGGGFIGSNIAKNYLHRGDFDVTLVDNFSRGQEGLSTLKDLNTSGRLEVIDLDLTEPSAYQKLSSKYDCVYMLAAMVGVNKVNSIPHEVIRVNTLIIMCTLEWLKTIECKRVLFTSTSETYAGTIGAFGVNIPTDEDVPLTIQDVSHPRFTYAITKILGESGVIQYSKAGYFDAVIVRYHNVYGPMMGFRHVIPHLAERFMKGENPFKIYGHDQTRAFNYITDAVSGTIAAAELGRSGEIYHIGDTDEISIETLTKFVGQHMGYGGQYQYAETFPGSVSRRCPNITKAVKELDYKPEVNWQNGVTNTINWYTAYLQAERVNSESFYDQYGIKR